MLLKHLLLDSRIQIPSWLGSISNSGKHFRLSFLLSGGNNSLHIIDIMIILENIYKVFSKIYGKQYMFYKFE